MIHPAELLEYMQNLLPEDKRDDEIVQLLLPVISKGINMALKNAKSH